MAPWSFLVTRITHNEERFAVISLNADKTEFTAESVT
jgi:hypothetical protein